MPETTVYFYCEESGSSPILEWFKQLRRTDKRAFAACRARVLLLGMMGHELRRPYADHLRNGIHELRARCGQVNYRLLYFFHGKDVAVLAHGITKEQAVPDEDIDRTLVRKRRYERAPAKHRAKAGSEDL